MALTISKLKMWKDPGYTRNCTEVPPAGSWKLPAADYTLAADETLRPHKGSTLTELHLPLSFTQTFGMSYLYIEASDGAGSVSMFGWITSIEQRSTAAEGIVLMWEPDYWRTYSGTAVWGAGVVTKCSDASYKRPYRTQPRHWTSSKTDMTPLCNTDNVPMVYLIAVLTHDGISSIHYYEFPVYDAGHVEFVFAGTTTPTYYTLSLSDCYKGLVDELLGSYCAGLVDTSYEIIGCYASMIRPSVWDIKPAGYASTVSAGTIITGTVNGSTYAMVEQVQLNGLYNAAFSPSISTDDMVSYEVVDYIGNSIGALPYGVPVSGVTVRLDIGVNGAYERIQFKSSIFGSLTNSIISHRALKKLGLEFSIPCITIPITSNQWSAYLTGGQRDYDITSARIANDQKGVSGLESTIQAGIGGGVTGSTAGALGAIGGLLGGMIAQGSMSAIQYGLGKNFNDQLQDATDRLYANQRNGIMITGGSKRWFDDPNNEGAAKGCYLMKLTADTTSATEYSQDISVNGYDVNIAVTSASSFITAGGALRIANLNVTGNIPPQAKQYIKNKLEAGVRIVENNPSGTAP